MARHCAVAKWVWAPTVLVVLISGIFTKLIYADDKNITGPAQQPAQATALPSVQVSPPQYNSAQEIVQIQRDIAELKTSAARLERDSAHLTETDNRTWDVVVALGVGLILSVIGAGTAMWAWPRRVLAKARRDIVSEAARAVAQLTESGGSVTRQLEEHVEVLTSRLKGLISVEVVLATGRHLQNQGKIDDAIVAYSEALVLDPLNAFCLYNRGLCYRKKGRRYWDSALADLRQALTHESYRNNPDAVFSLAEALYAHGDHVEARSRAQTALELGVANKAGAHTLIGDCFRRASRGVDGPSLENAISAYDQCLSGWHWHTQAIEGKAFALMALGRYDEAVHVCSEPIDNGQISSNYYRIRAQALWRRNRDDDHVKAWNDLGESKKRNPRDTMNYVLEANFLQSQATEVNGGQAHELLKKAVATLRQGCDFSPPAFKPVFRNRLTGVLLQLGDTGGAMAEAEKSVAESGQFVQNWMALAVARLAGRRWIEARNAAEEGLKVASHAPGRMWCKFFKVVAAACQGEGTARVAQFLGEIEQELEQMPYFQPFGGWYHRVILDTIANCAPSMEQCNAGALTTWAGRLFTAESQEEETA
jgi:tetratricopeptide (TPR) repeat protein